MTGVAISRIILPESQRTTSRQEVAHLIEDKHRTGYQETVLVAEGGTGRHIASLLFTREYLQEALWRSTAVRPSPPSATDAPVITATGIPNFTFTRVEY